MAAGNDQQREFDFIVHGATGFSGKLVAAYAAVATRGTSPLRWAVSGRSQEKLEAEASRCVQDTTFQSLELLGTPSASVAPPAVVVANSMDPADMKALAARAHVIIAVAGPYTRCGLPLAAACAETGTHYVDLTGEHPFIRRLIDELDGIAATNHAFLLPCNGIEAVANELGNVVAHDAARDAKCGPLRHVVSSTVSEGFAASRGTFLSFLAVPEFETAADKSPLSLVDAERRDSCPVPAKYPGRPTWCPALKRWVLPAITAPCADRLVRRANALVPSRRGATYSDLAAGTFGQVVAAMMIFAIMKMFFWPLIGGPLARMCLPPEQQDGEEAAKKQAGFKILVAGYTESFAEVSAHPDTATPAVQATLTSSTFGGYPFTAIVAVETALALRRKELDPEARVANGGVRTAGSTVAAALRRRLAEIGVLTTSMSIE